MADMRLSFGPSNHYSTLEALIDEAEIDAETRRGFRRARPRRGPRPPKVSRPARRARGRAPSRCVCPAHGTEFVGWVQSSLNQVLGANLAVSGTMDRATRSALRRFQEQNGLPADGIAGPDTERALIDATGGRAPTDGLPLATVDGPGESSEFEFEFDEFEWESELNRNSREYVVWVQASLNRILGQRLTTDGIVGPLTRSAIRSFQAQKGLAVDGIVGPVTEVALIAAGAGRPPGAGTAPAPGTSLPYPNVNRELPPSGPGFYSYMRTAGDGRSHQYGRAETIQAIQAIAAAWHRAHPQGPQIGIGHISLRGGGDTPDHAQHETGLEVDIRPVRNDGQHAGVTISDPRYSRALTQKLVDLIHANRVLSVYKILFNDSSVSNVSPASGHDNHLHVWFAEPSAARSYFELDAMMDDEADLASEAFAELFESSDDAEARWEQERGGRRPAGRGRGRRIRSPRPRQDSRPRPPKLGRPTRPRGRLRRHQRSVGRPAAPCVCPAHGTELVRWIQSTLNDLRALQLPVSGLMDRATRSALRAFQTERGLAGDGIAGPETKDALIRARAERSGRAIEGLEPAPPAAEPAGVGVGPEATEELESFWDAMELGARPTLRRGSRGSTVVDLQTRLKTLSFDPGAIEGVFGSGTDAAIRAFQGARGLAADGIVGSQTWGQLLGQVPAAPGGGVSTANWVLPPDVRSAGEAQYVRYDSPPRWAGDPGNCSGTFTLGAQALRQHILATFAGVTSIGGYACRANTANLAETSVHGDGRALDIMIPLVNGGANSTVGNPIANWLVRNAQALGLQYLIWNRVQWSGGKTSGRKDASYGGPNPHIDHIHAELNRDGAARQTPWFQPRTA